MASTVTYADPNTVAQLEADQTSAPAVSSGSNYVTDPSVLSQLNAAVPDQSNEVPYWQKVLLGGVGFPAQNPSAGDVTALKSTLSSIPDLISNITSRFGHPLNIPQSIQVTPQEKAANPVKNFAGSLIGAAPLGAAADAATLRLIPSLEMSADSGALANLMRGSARSGLVSGELSKPGNTLEDMAIGASVPVGAYGIGKGVGYVGSGIGNFVKNAVDVMQSKSALKDIINAPQLLKQAHAAQADNIGAGQDNNVILRNGILNDVEAIKSKIRPLYNQVSQNLSGKNVTIPENLGMADVIQQLKDSTPLDDSSDTPADVDNALNVASTNPNEVDANNAIKIWKSARDRAKFAENKMYKSNLPGGESERLQWTTQFKKLNPVANALRGVLESQIDPETLALQDSADQQWGNNVSPLTKSPIYKLAATGKTMPNNLIESISGNEPQNSSMRNLILNNPTLRKAALGKMYGKAPQKMMQWNEAAEPYIAADPQTSELRNNQLLAASNLQKTKDYISKRNKLLKHGAFSAAGTLAYVYHRKLFDALMGY